MSCTIFYPDRMPKYCGYPFSLSLALNLFSSRINLLPNLMFIIFLNVLKEENSIFLNIINIFNKINLFLIIDIFIA